MATNKRALHELINLQEPALANVREWIAAGAKCPVEVLPCTQADGERALLNIQVTTRSPLGAIIHGTGGILVDDGWLRILGGGCPRLPRNLPDWNDATIGLEKRHKLLFIADDVIGGFFALNDGGIEGVAPRKVAYLAPDTLKWEDMGLGYTDFLCWSWSGQMDKYYEKQRWPGWREECRALPGDRTFSLVPPLFLKGPPIAERKKGTIDTAAALGLLDQFREQIDGLADA